MNSVQNRREKTKSNLQGSKLLSNMFLQRKMIAVKYDDALDTLPSRATLCYESFEISLIRIFTNSSDPVDKNLVLVQNCLLKNLVLVQKAVEKFG